MVEPTFAELIGGGARNAGERSFGELAFGGPELNLPEPQQPDFAPPVAPAIQRGLNRTSAGIATLSHSLGMSDDESLINNLLNEQAYEKQFPAPPEYEAARKRAADENIFLYSNIKQYLQEPGLLLTDIGEQAAGSFAGLAGIGLGAGAGALATAYTGPGALAGATAGATIGGGLGSVALEYGPNFSQYLKQELGVKEFSPEMLRYALSNPDLMRDVSRKAAAKAGIIGIFDAIGMRIGGKLAAKALAPKATLLDKAKQFGKAVGVDAGAAMAGEAVGQGVVEGELNPYEIGQEGLLEVMGGGVFEVGTSAALRAARRNQERAAETAPTAPVDPEEVTTNAAKKTAANIFSRHLNPKEYAKQKLETEAEVRRIEQKRRDRENLEKAKREPIYTETSEPAKTEEEVEKELNDQGVKTRDRKGNLTLAGKKKIAAAVKASIPPQEERIDPKEYWKDRKIAEEPEGERPTPSFMTPIDVDEEALAKFREQRKKTKEQNKLLLAVREVRNAMFAQMGESDPEEIARNANREVLLPALAELGKQLTETLERNKYEATRESRNIGKRWQGKTLGAPQKPAVDTRPNVVSFPERERSDIDPLTGKRPVTPQPEFKPFREYESPEAEQLDSTVRLDGKLKDGQSLVDFVLQAAAEGKNTADTAKALGVDTNSNLNRNLLLLEIATIRRHYKLPSMSTPGARAQWVEDYRNGRFDRIKKKRDNFVEIPPKKQNWVQIPPRKPPSSPSPIEKNEVSVPKPGEIPKDRQLAPLPGVAAPKPLTPEQQAAIDYVNAEADELKQRADTLEKGENNPVEEELLLGDIDNLTSLVANLITDLERVEGEENLTDEQMSFLRQEEAVRKARDQDTEERQSTENFLADLKKEFGQKETDARITSEREKIEKSAQDARDAKQERLREREAELAKWRNPPKPPEVRVEEVNGDIIVTQSEDPNQKIPLSEPNIIPDAKDISDDLVLQVTEKNDIPTRTELATPEVLQIVQALEGLNPKESRTGLQWKEFITRLVENTIAVDNVFDLMLRMNSKELISAESLLNYVNKLSLDTQVNLAEPEMLTQVPIDTETTRNELEQNAETIEQSSEVNPGEVLAAVEPAIGPQVSTEVTPAQLSFATLNFDNGIDARITVENLNAPSTTYAFRSVVDSEGSLVMVLTNAPTVMEINPANVYSEMLSLVKWATQNGYQYIVIPPELSANRRETSTNFSFMTRQFGRAVDILLVNTSTDEAQQVKGYALGKESRYLPQRGKAIPDPRPTATLEISAAAKTALYAKGIRPTNIKKMSDAAYAIMKRFGIQAPVTIRIMPLDRTGTGYVRYDGFRYEILMNTSTMRNVAQFYLTLMHEVGHIIVNEKLAHAPIAVRQAINADYEASLARFMKDGRLEDPKNYLANIGAGWDERILVAGVNLEETAMYYTTRREWLAETIAKWATTDRVPLTLAEKFYKSLVTALKKVYREMAIFFGMPDPQFDASPTLRAWLNSYVRNPDVTMERAFDAKLKADVIERNANHLRFDIETREIDPTDGAQPLDPRDTIGRKLFGTNVPATMNSTAAVADRFNKMHRMFLGLHQVARNNPHIRQLSNMVQLFQQGDLYRQQILDRAVQTQKLWEQLPPSQNKRLVEMIDDYVQMTYLTEEEKKKKVVRKPNQQEMMALAKKHNMGQDGMKVFSALSNDFTFMLGEMETNAINAANKISNPVQKAAKLKAIAKQFENLRKIPYFPLMRFGKYTVTVYDSTNVGKRKVIAFEMTETKKEQQAAVERLKREHKDPGLDFKTGIVSEDIRPFAGMPPAMLDLVGKKLKLSQAQRNALEQLKYSIAAGDSFRKRMMRRKVTSGYSREFKRSYEHYMLHGSMFLARVRYADAMRDQVRSLSASKHDYPDTTLRQNLAAFLQESLDLWSNPKSDGRLIKALGFVMFLGFNPASALLNLSQIKTTSYPYLASKFGDRASSSALFRAFKSVESYYKRDNLPLPAKGQGLSSDINVAQMQALGKAMELGIVDEAMSAELAGYAHGSSFARRWGFDAVNSNFNSFVQASSFVFRMTEQMARRTTFRAAFTLAKQNPTAKSVKEARDNFQNLFFKQLKDEGWTDADATAFVFAKQAVEETQYLYSSAFQARFMTGGAGSKTRGLRQSVFMFKTFLQSTLYFAFSKHNADSRLRYLLVMMAVGGLLGLPGAEDVEEFTDLAGKALIGGHFSTRLEMRKFIVGMTNGSISPDVIMHGTSKYGYGMQVIKDLTGFPIPVVDRSRAQATGPINPIPYGLLLNPQGKPDEAVTKTIERISGPVGGYALGVWRAMNDMKNNATDPKRWERVVPKFVANVSKAWRAYDEGLERSPSGTTMATFDPNNWQDFNEILAMGMGYNPLKLSARWDAEAAKADVNSYWDMRRRGVLARVNAARRGGDEEEFKEMIKEVQEFNNELPPAYKGYAISGQSLRQSVNTSARRQVRQEMGIGARDREFMPNREIQTLFPESPVDVRKVR